MSECTKLIRSVLLPYKDGLLLEEFRKEYCAVKGEDILTKGYRSLEAYLRSLPKVCRIEHLPSGEIIVMAVPDKSTEHIFRMVQSQLNPSSGYNRRTLDALDRLRGTNEDGNPMQVSNQSQPMVSEYLKKQIKELLHLYKEGLTYDEMKCLYYKHFRVPLDYKGQGFKDMDDFCIHGLNDSCFCIEHHKICLRSNDNYIERNMKIKPKDLEPKIVEMIFEVLDKNPNGILDSYLNQALSKEFGLVINPLSYNFNSMRSLLAYHNDLFVLDDKWQVKRNCFEVQFAKYDTNMCALDRFDIGEVYTVTETCLKNLSYSWFLLTNKSYDLYYLHEEMTDFYSSIKSTISSSQVQINDLVAVKGKSFFYRGCVLQISNHHFKVQLLDAGNIKWYDQVYCLNSQFLKLPFQGLRVNIKSTKLEVLGDSGLHHVKTQIKNASLADSLSIKILSKEGDVACGVLFDSRHEQDEEI